MSYRQSMPSLHDFAVTEKALPSSCYLQRLKPEVDLVMEEPLASCYFSSEQLEGSAVRTSVTWFSNSRLHPAPPEPPPATRVPAPAFISAVAVPVGFRRPLSELLFLWQLP